MDEVAPSVAREAVERGWELSRMCEEAPTPENVFREVGEGGGHGG